MIFFIKYLCYIMVWMMCGIIAFTFVDDRHNSLFKWTNSAPNSLCYIGALLLWPVVVFFFNRRRG